MSITSQNLEQAGLGTLAWNVDTAGPYFIKGKISVPTLVGGGGASAVVATVKQNGTTIYTGPAGAQGFYLNNILCALNDAMSVVFSSSAPADLPLNVIRSVVSYGLGQ
jgi:hypothetical protein